MKQKLKKIVLATISTSLVGCASASARGPAGEQLVMSGEWCESAVIKATDNNLIEVKMKNLEMEVDRNRDHRSCQIAVPIQVPEGSSLKIKNFSVGNSAKVEGTLDFWQERRELLAQGRPVLGGLLTRRQESLKSYDFKESQLGRLDFPCGQSQVLKLDLSHTVVSMKNAGEVSIESPSYKIEYEISDCRKPASSISQPNSSPTSETKDVEALKNSNSAETETSAPVFNKVQPIPDQNF